MVEASHDLLSSIKSHGHVPYDEMWNQNQKNGIDPCGLIGRLQ